MLRLGEQAVKVIGWLGFSRLKSVLDQTGTFSNPQSTHILYTQRGKVAEARIYYILDPNRRC